MYGCVHMHALQCLFVEVGFDSDLDLCFAMGCGLQSGETAHKNVHRHHDHDHCTTPLTDGTQAAAFVRPKHGVRNTSRQNSPAHHLQNLTKTMQLSFQTSQPLHDLEIRSGSRRQVQLNKAQLRLLACKGWKVSLNSA